MKTFTQFNEDVNRLTQRRQQLRQRQLDQMQAYKDRVSAYRERSQNQEQNIVTGKQIGRAHV